MIDLKNNQRTLAWFRARLGNFTGSRVGDLMKSGRSKADVFGEVAKSYIQQVAAERMMNPDVVEDDDMFAEYVASVDITSRAMRFGTEQEDNARKLFARLAKVEIVEPSSCRHDEVEHFAASPDGLITVDLRPTACVEIKCPKQETFVKYLSIHDNESLKKVNPLYYWQTQAEMSCTDTGLCYFVVFCPWQRKPLHVARIERDAEDEAALIERIRLANGMIDDIMAKNDGRESVIQGVQREVYERALDYTKRLFEPAV